MDIYEITGFQSGLEHSGVNFLDPADAFEVLENGFIYRQELKTRKGFVRFGARLAGEVRVMGIFENVHPNGTTDLLVIDKLYLYKYNTVTQIFDKVPFNARLDPVPGVYNFNISNDYEYVSGTTYLNKDGASRFVFTGKGMSAIYFYDGTSVGQFNYVNVDPLLQDNPDYRQPPEGVLEKATHVKWFDERLNFFVPVIGTTTYSQGILCSGIRDASGKGDQFDVPGSALYETDTYENMRGVEFLGDAIVMSFSRSSWLLQKTKDAFNPYVKKKIHSVLGVDSDFTSVSYGYEVKGMGKTGMISTDGRQSVRFDNKIPHFTRDNIDQEHFELSYGGFDRENSQFMFAYRANKSKLDDVTQDKVLVYNYEFSTWSVYDQRFTVFGQTTLGKSLSWDEIDETQKESWATWDTTGDIWDRVGQLEGSQKTLAGDNEGFIYRINADYDDYFADISAITQAASAVLTVDASAFKVGDEVYINGVVGMTEINEATATIIAATNTTITVKIPSTDFTAYTSGGYVSKLINFKAQLAPFNPYRDQGRKCYVSHVEFLLDVNPGELYVDVYEDEEDTLLKTVLLEPNTETQRKREWITMTINQESNFLTFVLRRNSASTQTVVSSIRVHCSMGGLTS